MLKTYLISSICVWLSASTISSVFTRMYDQDKTELQESVKKGRRVYSSYCGSCHMPNGEGVAGTFPPLAGSDFLMNKQEEAIKAVWHGITGEIQVNGETYDGHMPEMGLSAEEVTDVMNYINNSWGNEADMVTVEQVKNLEEK